MLNRPWLLFLKWYDDYEKDKEKIRKLDGKKYKNVIRKEFQWSSWAIKKRKDGTVDEDCLTGGDLIKFINKSLFPYLAKLG